MLHVIDKLVEYPADQTSGNGSRNAGSPGNQRGNRD